MQFHYFIFNLGNRLRNKGFTGCKNNLRNFFLLILIGISTVVSGQAKDTLAVYPLQLDLPLLDYPFSRKASKTGQLFDNYSMQQSLAVTRNIHRVNYHFNNRLWYNILKPDTKRKKIYNRIGANLSSGIIDYIFTYYGVVLSPQWMHEEFHRNGLTLRDISSYNETYNRFNGGNANGSVSDVTDEDLIRFKKDHPQELVRSFSAGVESEFLLLRGLQQDNFFDKSKYPNILLNILLTKHAIDYVNQFRNDDYNASIDSMNTHGQTIRERDFVGWDFTPWVYDLHRPDEPYEARGVHPSGAGIDRAIKTTSLTQEEYSYLKKMGNMQYLNLISPFMIGVNRIRLNDHTAFNFAVRHYLNSFGYNLTTDLFLELRNKQYLFAFHGYRNKNLFLPGVELSFPSLKIKNSKKDNWTFQPALMIWMQPQDFYSDKGKLGGLLRLRADQKLNSSWRIFGTLESKTRGWVAGNPFLESNVSIRAGLSARFEKKFRG